MITLWKLHRGSSSIYHTQAHSSLNWCNWFSVSDDKVLRGTRKQIFKLQTFKHNCCDTTWRSWLYFWFGRVVWMTLHCLRNVGALSLVSTGSSARLRVLVAKQATIFIPLLERDQLWFWQQGLKEPESTWKGSMISWRNSDSWERHGFWQHAWCCVPRNTETTAWSLVWFFISYFWLVFRATCTQYR